MIQSNVCTKSRISKVYRNVTLRDGINSGEFTDRGSVFNMEDCIKQCCSDDNCNLAFIIKDTCFTVKCKSYEACSLKAAISRYYNPRIAYVSWSPPKENLGVGKSCSFLCNCISSSSLVILKTDDVSLHAIFLPSNTKA